MKEKIIQQENPFFIYLFFFVLSWMSLKKSVFIEMKRREWKERYEVYSDHKDGL
ncbi:hypothetical protein ACJA3J_07620 [Halobacillus sp. SY10]|uniref:hypothetical protein n=1 Tax=Halobacillus TaxID=45667 RepID=UPI0015F254D7|nr:hypothetical protein [Halobacillus trueperi]